MRSDRKIFIYMKRFSFPLLLHITFIFALDFLSCFIRKASFDFESLEVKLVKFTIVSIVIVDLVFLRTLFITHERSHSSVLLYT